MPIKEEVVRELRRVASALGLESLSRNAFRQHEQINDGTVEYLYGTWNEAVTAAGLQPLPPGGVPRDEKLREERITAPATSNIESGRLRDKALLDYFLRLASLLGRRPSGNQVDAKGKHSASVYKRRWGSISKAHDLAKQLEDN